MVDRRFRARVPVSSIQTAIFRDLMNSYADDVSSVADIKFFGVFSAIFSFRYVIHSIISILRTMFFENSPDIPDKRVSRVDKYGGTATEKILIKNGVENNDFRRNFK